MSQKIKHKLLHAVATYPVEAGQGLFEELIEEMKPFATTVELHNGSKYVVIQSLPPEFDDDFTLWHDDLLTYFVQGLEFQVRALEARIGIEAGDYKWDSPINQAAETEVKVEINGEEYTRKPFPQTHRDFEDTLKLM